MYHYLLLKIIKLVAAPHTLGTLTNEDFKPVGHPDRMAYIYKKAGFNIGDELPECFITLMHKYATNNTHSARASMAKRGHILRIWKADKERCSMCRKKLPFSAMTIEHVYPTSLGYSGKYNYMPTCGPCNHDKKSDLPSLSYLARCVWLHWKTGRRFAPEKK